MIDIVVADITTLQVDAIVNVRWQSCTPTKRSLTESSRACLTKTVSGISVGC